MIDGEGSPGAPDEVGPGANMPGFREFLTEPQMATLVTYLAARASDGVVVRGWRARGLTD